MKVVPWADNLRPHNPNNSNWIQIIQMTPKPWFELFELLELNSSNLDTSKTRYGCHLNYLDTDWIISHEFASDCDPKQTAKSFKYFKSKSDNSKKTLIQFELFEVA